MKKSYLTLSIIFCLTYLQSNPLDGYKIGISSSVGFVMGEMFWVPPVGASIILTSPSKFNYGPFALNTSFGFGQYSVSDGLNFNPIYIGIGGNLKIANIFSTEVHISRIGEGSGMRSYLGITLERLMKNNLNLPFNILIGGEGFIGNNITGSGNASFWGGPSFKIDYAIGSNLKYVSRSKGPSAQLVSKGKNIKKIGTVSAEAVGNFLKKPSDLIEKSINNKINNVSIEIPKVNKTIYKKDVLGKSLKIVENKASILPIILNNNIKVANN